MGKGLLCRIEEMRLCGLGKGEVVKYNESGTIKYLIVNRVNGKKVRGRIVRADDVTEVSIEKLAKMKPQIAYWR